ncbi:hypothetical protein AB6A40_002936 [Gnathostoma spinigerum]|uniref:Phorbol-ester/DAG-type domain-containing protein n=1 Tax=Gnathostoma spinigerum TaxID=75299 RepID=A0ABD6EAB0_9BILA
MCEGEVLRLEGVIKDQANLIEDLKAQLRTVSSLSESQLLSASNRVSDRQSQIYQSLISQLREEVSGNKKLLAAARGLLELEKATCKNQEKELEKRRRQLEESIENSKALEKELKKVRTECSEKNWEARERILAMKMNAARMEDEKKIAALEARIELKLRQEASLLDELTSLRTLHEKCEREKLVRDEECKKHQTEVERLKSELEKQKSFQNSNASRRVVRTESMEDKLISQVNSLSRQLENLKGSSLSEVGYKSLHEKVDSLVSVETYLKERLEASQQAEEKLKLELDNMAKNLATKDSDIATLNKRIEEQEEQFRLTNEYLVQENVKIKHQKAEIRCELLELKRRYSRLENVYENNRHSSSVVELEVKSAEEMEDPRKSSCEKELRTKKSTNSKQEDQKWCLEMSEVRNVSIVREVETHSSEIKLAEVPPILGYNIHVKTLVDASTECSDVQNEEAEKAMKLLAEEVVVKDTVIEKLQKEIVTLQDETFKLKKLATYLDDQCEKLMTAKKRAEVGRTKLSEELAKRSSDLSVLRLEVENYRQKEEQSAVNMKVNERLEQQNKYLQDELTEMNTQHRLEITRLAKEMSETKKKDATENECFAIEIRRLKTEKRQMEATLQSLERQLEQGVTQKNLQTEEVKSLRENCTRLNEENAKLRNGLQTAIEKVEKFKEDFEKGNEERLQLKEEIQKMQEAQRDAEAKIDQLTETLNTKERLVVYLKNQQKVCQNEKAFKKASSFSTLISEGSEVSVISDVSVVDIEEQENRPKTSSTSLKKALEQPVPLGESSQNNIHSVPLLRDPNVNIDKSSNHDSNFPVSSNSDEIGSAGPICAEYQRSGTMKHDIPHRWKSFLALKQVKCVVCMEGIPRVRHAMKCSECGIIAHRCCYVTVVNTCGLPSQCADYFLNTYPGSTKPRTMSGWVKIWRSNHSLGGKWKNAFASINSCRLCFYNNDGLSAPSINCAPPFYEVNLERDKWRIQWQAVPDVGIKQDLSKDSYSLLIEIRLPTLVVFRG